MKPMLTHDPFEIRYDQVRTALPNHRAKRTNTSAHRYNPFVPEVTPSLALHSRGKITNS